MKFLTNVAGFLFLSSLAAIQAQDTTVVVPADESSALLDEHDPANDERNLGYYRGPRDPRNKPGFLEACNKCEDLKFSSYFPDTTGRPFLSILNEITDAIYDSDDASCLLLTIVKTARELICFLLDEFTPVPNPGGLGTQAEQGIGALSDQIAAAGLSAGPEGSTSLTTEESLMLFMQSPVDEDPFNIFRILGYNNAELNKLINSLAGAQQEGPIRARELQGDIIPPDTDEIWKEIIPPGFFFKCVDGFGIPPPICAITFALFTTQDAIICKYTQQKGCSIDKSCTDQLKFDIAYNARRIATIIPLPPFIDSIVGEIIAPCGSCINFKNPCAPFCAFAETFCDCDPYLRLNILDQFL